MTKIIIKNADWELTRELDQDIWKTLIKQMNDAGEEVMSACHHGICWACIYSVDSWVDNINKSFKWEPGFPLWEDEVMTCIAWIKWNDEEIILRSNH